MLEISSTVVSIFFSSATTAVTKSTNKKGYRALIFMVHLPENDREIVLPDRLGQRGKRSSPVLHRAFPACYRRPWEGQG